MGAVFDERGPAARGGEQRYAHALALVGAGAAARLVATGFASVAALAAVAITFRLLGTSDYGILAFALSVVALVPDLGRLGLATGAVREVSAADSMDDLATVHDAARGTFTATLAIGLAWGMVVFVVVLLSLDQLSIVSRVGLGLGLGVVIVGTQVAVGTSTIARGLGRVVAAEIPHTVHSVGRLIAVAILAALAIDTLGAVALGYAAAAVAAALIAIVQARRLLGPRVTLFRPAFSSARRLVKLSLPFAVTGLAGFVISRFDVVVLGLVRPSAEVGAYEPVLRALERLLLLVPLLFVAQGFTAATRLLAGGEIGVARNLYHHLAKVSFVLSLPALLVMAAFPETVLRLLYGKEFPQNPSFVWVLLIGFGVSLIFGMNGTFLGATGARRELVITGVISAVAMVTSAAILVPTLGGIGAAAATAIGYVVLNVTVAWRLFHAIGILPFRRDLNIAIASAILPLAIVLIARFHFPPGDIWVAVAWSFGAWGLWAGLLFGFGVLGGSDWRPLLTSIRPKSHTDGPRV